MSTSTARVAATLPCVDPSIGCISIMQEHADVPANFVEQKTNSDSIIQLWLSQMSPELQQSRNCEKNDTESRTMGDEDDDDDRVIVALGDLLVADNFSHLGSFRHDLEPPEDDVDRKKLELIRTIVTDEHARASSKEDERGGNDQDEHSCNDDDLMLQHCILESMASAKHENKQCLPGAENSTMLLPNNISADDPAVAVLTLNWADIELEEDEEPSCTESLGSQDVSEKTPLTSQSELVASELNSTGVFKCPWTAWYDPPKGRIARMGIASEAYEKKLFEMGIIECPEDFWTVHEMVDWNNMPCGSMVSFSRVGAKPLWEDPIHRHGGRWIIRGFPRGESESVFAKIALSLFLGHFPDVHELTCVTLQVKEKRRPNTIQLWTRTLDYAHIEEVQEHIFFLVDWRESNEQPTNRMKKNKRAKNVDFSPVPSQLYFEFCPNLESIERNAVKLGDVLPTSNSGRRPRQKHKPMQPSMASRCNVVSEMYSAGRSRKKGSKSSSKKRPGNAKVDWSDTLLQMGYKGNRVSRKYAVAQETVERNSSLKTASNGTKYAESGNLTPEKSRKVDPSNAAKVDGRQKQDENRRNATRMLARTSNKEENWRKCSVRPVASSPSCSSDKCGGGKAKKNLKYENADFVNWRTKKEDPSFSVFLETQDVEGLKDGGEPAFVEFDPRLAGLKPWIPLKAQEESSKMTEDYESTWIGSENDTWAPDYIGSNISYNQYMSITPCSHGTFDSHGCWYPPRSSISDRKTQSETKQSKTSLSAVASTTTIDSTREGSCCPSTLVSDNSVSSIEITGHKAAFSCASDVNRYEDLHRGKHSTQSEFSNLMPKTTEWPIPPPSGLSSSHYTQWNQYNHHEQSSQSPWGGRYHPPEHSRYSSTDGQPWQYAPDGFCRLPSALQEQEAQLYFSQHSSEISRLADNVADGTQTTSL